MIEHPNMQKRGYYKRRVCKFCTEPKAVIDYKEYRILKYFISERGKIIPRRISGNCAKHQRKLTMAIKRSRNIALLPFTSTTAL
jgi:small subunit ribosomal protein S18